MDKFKSQQHAVKVALTAVLGEEAIKGEVVLTPEQREQAGDMLLQWHKEGLWVTSEKVTNPEWYVRGKDRVCLIQNWLKKAPAKDRLSEIKEALDMGLISKEQATELVMQHISRAA